MAGELRQILQLVVELTDEFKWVPLGSQRVFQAEFGYFVAELGENGQVLVLPFGTLDTKPWFSFKPDDAEPRQRGKVLVQVPARGTSFSLKLTATPGGGTATISGLAWEQDPTALNERIREINARSILLLEFKYRTPPFDEPIGATRRRGAA